VDSSATRYNGWRNANVRAVIGGPPTPLVERRLFLPPALDGGAAFLRLQPALARSGGRPGRPAGNGRHRGAPDQFHETLARVLAGALLGAGGLGGGHRHAPAGEPSAREPVAARPARARGGPRGGPAATPPRAAPRA